jgi:ABC-type multidrug transport system fused ATPase/permease subunit
VDDADFVIVLDKGSIIESGSPEMLNKLDGLYAALKTRQKASANPVG